VREGVGADGIEEVVRGSCAEREKSSASAGALVRSCLYREGGGRRQCPTRIRRPDGRAADRTGRAGIGPTDGLHVSFWLRTWGRACKDTRRPECAMCRNGARSRCGEMRSAESEQEWADGERRGRWERDEQLQGRRETESCREAWQWRGEIRPGRCDVWPVVVGGSGRW